MRVAAAIRAVVYLQLPYRYVPRYGYGVTRVSVRPDVRCFSRGCSRVPVRTWVRRRRRLPRVTPSAACLVVLVDAKRRNRAVLGAVGWRTAVRRAARAVEIGMTCKVECIIWRWNGRHDPCWRVRHGSVCTAAACPNLRRCFMSARRPDPVPWRG